MRATAPAPRAFIALASVLSEATRPADTSPRAALEADLRVARAHVEIVLVTEAGRLQALIINPGAGRSFILDGTGNLAVRAGGPDAARVDARASTSPERVWRGSAAELARRHTEVLLPRNTLPIVRLLQSVIQ